MYQSPGRQPSEMFDPWSVVNHRLKKSGYSNVDIKTVDAGFVLKERTTVLDNVAAISLRSTILSLLDDLERKEEVMRDVLTRTHSKDQVDVVQGDDRVLKELKRKNEEIGDLDYKLNQLRVLCSTLEETCHNQDAELRVLRVQKTELGVASEDSETKRSSLAESLRGRIAELEYANAKLKLDLQNRPERKEWKESQKKMKEVENELEEARHILTLEQVKCAQLTKDLETIFSAGDAASVAGVLEVFASYRQKKDASSRMEKFISTVCEVINGSGAPQPANHTAVAMTPPHRPWCHVTWSHVIPTLNYWLKQFEGLKELYAVLCDAAGYRVDEDHTPVLSCVDLAAILKQWVQKRHNTKLVKEQGLPAMVAHFQQLFDVRDRSGVYPKMNEIYSQLHMYRNVVKTIQSQLNIDSCSTASLVLHVETLASAQNCNFWFKVKKEFGYSTAEEVIERLRFAEEFLPAFQEVVAELQSHLGVTSLGAITPTLKSRLTS